jgi:hypothetical protein
MVRNLRHYWRSSVCVASCLAGRLSPTLDSYEPFIYHASSIGPGGPTLVQLGNDTYSPYHLQNKGCVYQEPGGDYFDQLHAERLKRHLVKRLETLGVSVTLQPQAR